ncbi:MAG: efflux transporter outer membrane subunit [Pseudomonadota bacterium]
MKGNTLAALCAALAATACTTVGPDYEPPELESPSAWATRLKGGLTTAELNPTSLSAWWETLGDDTLNNLIGRAINANLDLRTAQAQLRQARAQRAATGGSRFPTIQAGASATSAGSGGNSSQLYSASFDAGWELDLFGGRRRSIEAADADLRTAEEARRDVLISMLAEVAVNYIELRAYQSQLAVAQDNLDNQLETLEIVEAQYRAGAVTQLDYDRAVSNVANTRSEIPRARQSLAQVKNRLAVLVGQAPGALEEQLSEPAPIPTPPVQLAVGVPAETLRRRPDVRQAERQLAAETARVGVAVAELYPKFTLSGTIGLEALSVSSLTDSDSRTFGIGPSVRWNLFDGGRTRQQIEVQSAVQEQALIQYERTVLGALEEVENAITAFTEEQLRYRALVESAAATERAADVARMRYEAGASDFIAVLDAERSLLSVQSNRVASEGTIVSNLVRLYKALGGGWDPQEPPRS